MRRHKMDTLLKDMMYGEASYRNRGGSRQMGMDGNDGWRWKSELFVWVLLQPPMSPIGAFEINWN